MKTCSYPHPVPGGTPPSNPIVSVAAEGSATTFRSTTALMRTSSRDGHRPWRHRSTIASVIAAVAAWTRLSYEQRFKLENEPILFRRRDETGWWLTLWSPSWRPSLLKRCDKLAERLFPSRRPLVQDHAWRRA